MLQKIVVKGEYCGIQNARLPAWAVCLPGKHKTGQSKNHARAFDAQHGPQRLMLNVPCRLKASLERLQRLTQSYADAMIHIFPHRASQLGCALGLDQDRVSVSLRQAHILSCMESGVQPGTVLRHAKRHGICSPYKSVFTLHCVSLAALHMKRGTQGLSFC